MKVCRCRASREWRRVLCAPSLAHRLSFRRAHASVATSASTVASDASRRVRASRPHPAEDRRVPLAARRLYPLARADRAAASRSSPALYLSRAQRLDSASPPHASPQQRHPGRPPPAAAPPLSA
eukprot:6329697-Prymnesium_polylepis.1